MPTRPVDAHLPRSAAYRADIDGLRAVAMLSVLAFHAYPGRLGGGFSGVDVFFVISGFLIGRDICSRLDGGTFSLRDFYVRRSRRIFPALATVLVCCATFGWMVLLPDEQKQLFSHVSASALFFQNFWLLSESGYFDSGAAFKPLRHLWSLSIEEQFYLVCPLGLMVLRNRRLRLLAVALVTLVSFAANLHLAASDPAATYYLPQTRAWQLLAGVLLALMPSPPGIGRLKEGVAWAGLLVLCWGFWRLGDVAGYPGGWGLLPVLGTAGLIAAGPDTGMARHLLSMRWLVYLGRISYPLYLWHWPLLAFLRVVYSDNPGTMIKTSALVLAFGLAAATHHAVEMPMRRARRPRMQALGLTVTLAMVAAGAWVLNTQAGQTLRPARILILNRALIRDVSLIHNQPRHNGCDDRWRNATSGHGYCQQSPDTPPSAAVLGDSHAQHVFNGISRLDKTRGWLLLGNSSCPPLPGIQILADGQDNCNGLSEATIGAVATDATLKTVVLAFYAHYAREAGQSLGRSDHTQLSNSVMRDRDAPDMRDPEEMVYRGLTRAIQRLASTGKQVVLYLDVPELPFQPRDCVARPMFPRKVIDCSVPRAVAQAQQASMRRVVRRLSEENPALRVYDPINALCGPDLCDILRSDMLVYRDWHHLSLRGSDMLAKPFLTWLGD